MMNYGEILAYWYLRFNGFIPMRDFVMHGVTNRRRSSDVDLLAVRFPYTREVIGGQPTDLDEWFRSVSDVDRSCIAVIAEVKTGPSWNRRDVEEAFSRERLEYALKRLGMFAAVDDALRALAGGKVHQEGCWTVLKIGFLDRPADSKLYHARLLSDVDQFVTDRLARCDRKYADRLFFQDPLIGYIAWKARRCEGHQGGLHVLNVQEVMNQIMETRGPVRDAILPKKPGIYAVYLSRDCALPPFAPAGSLIYVGKAEHGLDGRDLGTHFRVGKTGSSTLRRSIGSVLRESLSLKAIPRSDKRKVKDIECFEFTPDGEVRLTDWMLANLEIGYAEVAHGRVPLRLLEDAVIDALNPPFNLDPRYRRQNQHAEMLMTLRKACAREAAGQ